MVTKNDLPKIDLTTFFLSISSAAFRTAPAVPAEIGAPDAALTAEGWLRILPSMWAEKGGVDGFFIARLDRVG